MIKLNGIYRHYEGKLYQVLNVGKDAETLEDLVIYKDRNNIIWVLPYKVFTGKLMLGNSEMPMFQLLSDILDSKVNNQSNY